MLNKNIPYFIIWVFVASGCNSSFPVTIHGVSFEEYIQGERSQDSGYVSEIHAIHDEWQLVAVDFRHNDQMNGYSLKDLYLMLNLTNKEYIPERWKFSYPLYCHGKGVANGFTASYEFDNAGNIRFSNLSPKQSVNTPEKQVIEEWYFDALNTTSHYSIQEVYVESEKKIIRSLKLYSKFGLLIFNKYYRPSRQYEMRARAINNLKNGGSITMNRENGYKIQRYNFIDTTQ